MLSITLKKLKLPISINLHLTTSQWVPILTTILVIIAGFDVVALRVGEATIRANYVIYILAFCWLGYKNRIKLDKIQTLLIAGFILLSIPSIFVSYNLPKSIAYIAWTIFNYLFIFVVFSTLARDYQEKFHQGYLWGFRIQIIVGLVLFLLGIDLNGTSFNAGRAYLLYYEPSFFAIALTSYVGLVITQLFNRKTAKPWNDLFILAIAVYTTKSALLLITISIAFSIQVILNGFNLKRVALIGSALVGIIGVAQIYASFRDDLLAITINGVLNSSNPTEFLIGRGENRVPRMQCAWDVFLDHPTIGVGLGAYEAFTRNADLSTCLERGEFLFSKYDFITNFPPINIYIEALATTGLLGAIPFFLFLLRVIFFRRLNLKDPIKLGYWIGLATMLFIMNFQATYLTQCIWVALGAYFGSCLKPRSDSSYQVNLNSQVTNLP